MTAQLLFAIHQTILGRVEQEQENAQPHLDDAHLVYLDTLRRLQSESNERLLNVTRDMAQMVVSRCDSVWPRGSNADAKVVTSARTEGAFSMIARRLASIFRITCRSVDRLCVLTKLD